MDIFPTNPTQQLFGIKDIIKVEDINNIPTPATDNTNEKVTITNKKEAIETLKKSVLACNKCKLANNRNNIVFGEGNLDAKLMFIGEGPGAEEDLQGKPFVGESGQLLTRMIKAMTFEREDVYIANIVKCRPPDNRKPLNDEAAACIDYLKAQINIINPEYIVCLGSTAVDFLLQNKTQITKLRGNWQNWNGYKVMPTYHPAYLLRSPNKKSETWSDLKQVMKALGIKI